MPSHPRRFLQLSVLGLILTVALVVYGLHRQNQSGFSGRWTVYIEELIAQQGLTAEVEQFRYSFTDGFVSHGITLYDPLEPGTRLAYFQKVRLDIAQLPATKGKVEVKTISLEEGEAWIDLHTEDADRIHLTGLQCTLDLSRPYDIQLQDGHADIYGVPVSISGTCYGATRPREDSSEATPLTLELPQVMTEIFRHLYEIGSTSVHGPAVQLEFSHRAGQRNGLEIDVLIQGDDFSYRELDCRQIDAQLSYRNGILSTSRFYAEDDTGELTFTGEFDTRAKAGSFTVDSTTNLPKILRVLDISVLSRFANKLISPLPPQLQAQGTFQGTRDEHDQLQWTTHIYGHITLDEFRLLGTVFNSLDTEFSWKDNELYLRGMTVSHDEGEVTGRIRVGDAVINYQGRSTLPPALYHPFIKEGGIIASNIEKTQVSPSTSIDLRVQGQIDKNQLNKWDAQGTIHLQNISYDGVPLAAATSAFSISPSQTAFTDVAATFGYQHYIPSPYAQHQPSTGDLIAHRIGYDPQRKLVTLEGYRSHAWLGPIMNLFQRRIGSKIDNTVYFTAPPHLSGSGTIGIGDQQHRTRLRFQLDRPSDLYYTLLGQDVHLSQTQGSIRLIGPDIYLDSVHTTTLGGRLRGDFRITNPTSRLPSGKFAGDIAFNDLSLLQISDRYEFRSEKTVGSLTGRTSFSGIPGQVSTLQGEGFIGLDQADLYYIRIFGPLSPLLSSIAGSKDSSHEQVKSVSASFLINDGIVHTNDILSNTNSTVIQGHGIIDIDKKELDLTVRANTKGLLSLITLPLRPLEQLIQFRGRGPLSDPTWANAAFDPTPQTYPKTQPKAAIVVE